MRVTRVRRLGHQHANVFGAHVFAESERRHTPFRTGNRTRGETLPIALVLLVHGIGFAGPVLHLERLGIWVRPADANGIDVFFFVESDNDPLRMKRIVLAGESLRQIWIAFPIRAEVAIVEAGEAVELSSAVSGEPAVWQ